MGRCTSYNWQATAAKLQVTVSRESLHAWSSTSGASFQLFRAWHGASLVPWKGGKILVWDVTCPDTLAPSYAALAVHKLGAVAVEAEYRKTLKCGVLPSSCSFIPIVVETLGAIGSEARHFLTDVARHIEKEYEDKSALQHLLQRISISVQRGNAVSVLATLS